MALTIGDVLTQVRDIVQDVDTPQRNDDDKLMRYFNSAMADVRRLRADLFISSISRTWVTYDSSQLNQTFPLDVTYFSTLVDYLVSMVELGDDEFSVDGRSAVLHRRFVTKLTGKFA